MQRVRLAASQEQELYRGLTEAALPWMLSRLVQSDACSIVLCASDALARTLRAALPTHGKDSLELLILPEIPEDPDHPALADRLAERIATLCRLLEAPTEPRLLLASASAMAGTLPRPQSLRQHSLELAHGASHSFSDLPAELAALGYASARLVEEPGQYAVRGGLIDVYPINAGAPVRLDFFGDEIESIQFFDTTTQRSEGTLDQVLIGPDDGSLIQGEAATLFDYLPERIHWLLLEPDQLEQEAPALFHRPERLSSVPVPDLLRARESKADRWSGLLCLQDAHPFFSTEAVELTCEELGNHREFPFGEQVGIERVDLEKRARLTFLEKLVGWQREGLQIEVYLGSEGERERFEACCREHATLEALNVEARIGAVGEGFLLRTPDLWPGDAPLLTAKGLVLVSSREVFGGRRRQPGWKSNRKAKRRAQVDQLLDFHELAEGDHVVHFQHGIAIYRGLREIAVDEDKREVITLEFDEGVTLHVPLHESHLIGRYVGLSRVAPKLGKLGGTGWAKARDAAERATLDFAAELLNLQAIRDASKGHAFGPDTDWQRDFEQAFPHNPTPDQLRSVAEIKEAMEQPVPMDHLLCGDVGFGKTEVALRAAFKAVMDGKQVAVLVPTTVLCQQHYQTFRERMLDFPVVVEMLSRFRKPAQQKRIVGELAAGRIDIIVGTHALLAKRVNFQRLGLIIIDEEHRFGVRHKEQLKQMRAEIDILSMSATPIPRTLYMALMGARHLSVIETAPVDRLPIETHVRNYDEHLIKQAILHELERGGQVFYLHNRVQTIEGVAGRLREWLPGVNIGVGHGQMEERELEHIMTEFVEGRYQVLVCTTIIESGLDIPNCNTLIIEGADRFGLSQLYQLRGRVGRFNRQAHAWLLLHRSGQVAGQARKRLQSLRQHNQLGAGFRIAMRDLELRGAGAILGEKQSGHIAGVGFELYCQLLKRSVDRLRGESPEPLHPPTLRLDFVRVGEHYAKGGTGNVGYDALREAEGEQPCPEIRAELPASYIGESSLRIDFYRQLTAVPDEEALAELQEGLADRFGKLPESALALVELSRVRILATALGLARVLSEGSRLKCSDREGHFLKQGSRFPRLTAPKPMARLREISRILKRYLRERS